MAIQWVSNYHAVLFENAPITFGCQGTKYLERVLDVAGKENDVGRLRAQADY